MEQTVIVAQESEPRRFRVTRVRSRTSSLVDLLAVVEGPGTPQPVRVELHLECSQQQLTRLRDQSKMLQGLSPRQVSVGEGPFRLAGRFAVVREHRGGRDLAELLRTRGPLPASAALPLVAAVAGTLDELWNRPRADGKATHLLHRKVCPASLELDPDGAVRLCDFSLARAHVDGLEGETAWLDPGARGYVAPERLEGQEDPRGDIFSLGLVLEELVTGMRPGPVDEAAATVQIAIRVPPPVLMLAGRMRATDPRDRPTAAEVVETCRTVGETLWGPSLADWAAEHVLPEPEGGEDELVGAVLVQGMEAPRLRERPRPKPAATPVPVPPTMFQGPHEAARPIGWMALGALAVLIAGAAATAVVGAGLGLFVAAGPVTAKRAEVATVPALDVPATPEVPVEPAPAPVVAAADPAPEEEEVAPPAVVAPSPRRAPRPTAPRAAPAPVAPAPVAPAPAASVAVGTVSVSGADGATLVSAAGRFPPGEVPAGEYMVWARFGDQEVPAGKVVIPAAGTVALACDKTFLRCRAR